MHRFNALTFTYVRVVCAQLPPRLHSPTPPTAPHASSPPPLGTSCAHWRWRLPQYVPTNYVYSRLQVSDMHRQTNLAQLNWELGNSRMGMWPYWVWVWVWVWDWVWLWFWFCAPGCPLASTSASSTHRQRFGILAFWVGDAVPTSFPLRRGYDSDSDSNPDSIAISISSLDSTRVWVRVRVRCAFYVNLLTTILAFVCALLCVAGWIPLVPGLSKRSLTSCGIC